MLQLEKENCKHGKYPDTLPKFEYKKNNSGRDNKIHEVCS